MTAAVVEPVTAGDDVACILALMEEWLAAERAGDLPRLLACVTDDVVFLPPGAPPIEWPAAVRATYARMFARYRVERAVDIAELRVLGDWAFCWATETATFTPHAGGAPTHLTGHSLSLLRRTPEGWRFCRGINNLLPAEGAAASG